MILTRTVAAVLSPIPFSVADTNLSIPIPLRSWITSLRDLLLDAYVAYINYRFLNPGGENGCQRKRKRRQVNQSNMETYTQEQQDVCRFFEGLDQVQVGLDNAPEGDSSQKAGNIPELGLEEFEFYFGHEEL